MSEPLYIQVTTAAATSSAFVIPQAHLASVLLVPSRATGPIMLQFTPTSGTAPWYPFFQVTAPAGFTTTVYSGPGPAAAFVPPVPTPWAQIAPINSFGGVSTFTLLKVNRS